jgi:endonuclease/exonuclease/phosphatase family metal-dependent hydrolase
MSKPLKLIQLNCFQFTYFDQILKFLKEQNADIINLQEATTGPLSKFGDGIYLNQLAKELNMQIIYSPFTAKESKDSKLDWFGNAILTKLEILDYGTHWLHDGQTKVGIMKVEDQQKLQEAIKINRNLAYPIVYNQPKNLVWALLSHDGKVFRNITTHFTATQKCTETLQMIQEAQAVCDFIGNIKAVPTIFSGDLNIHQGAGCIELLKQKFSLVNQGSINTLTPAIHQIFEPKYQEMDPGLKNGLSVDYVFQRDIVVNKWQIAAAQISDHLPIIVEFELK